jgi:hypothetical protein
MVVGDFNFGEIKIDSGELGIFRPEWDREKNELKILRLSEGTKVNYNVQFAFSIAFGEVEGLAGQPVIPFLHSALDAVESVIAATEEGCRRIGILS